MSAAKRVASDPQTEAAQALEDTGQLLDPEVAAELERLRSEAKSSRMDWERLLRAEQRRAELEAVLATHRKDDQAEIERLQARVAELEAERHVTNEALSDAAEHLRADRDRIAELEQQLTAKDRPVDEDPIAYALTEKVDASADKLTRLFAPTQALREPLEDPHDGPLHHDYRVGRDLPETGSTK